MNRRREATLPQVRVRVPAKVNLFLAVKGRRADGMHDIISVLQSVSIFDQLSATFERRDGPHVRSTGGPVEVVLEHDAPGVPYGEENLAVKAARRLAGSLCAGALSPAAHPSGRDLPRRSHSSRVLMTRLVLEKRIPVAGGMAGGSADAAAALLALNRLWECGLDHEALRNLAATLGADVPFCLTGGTALATGTGVAAAQVMCRGTYHWVLGIDERPLLTRRVYEAWDEVATPSSATPDAVLQALRAEDPEALAAGLHNDLEVSAFHLRPALREASEALLDAGALRTLVSGSGPTLLALATDARHARRIAAAVGERFDRVEVVTSPAGGPEVCG